MVQTAAALLQGPAELPFADDQRDQFWTLVAYHNSLRELGKTVNLASDDIPARIKVIAVTEDDARDIDPEEVVELTSNVSAAAIPARLEQLGIRRGRPGAISFVACTNMVSVGVDVPRLGLMLVAGQPKSTGEYIQATSRVGRKMPGFVVILYSAAKPRDRSHYESFKTYHSSIYRQVEPTSVTPFSLPARQRALHAALVIIVRHAVGLAAETSAALFDEHSPALAVLRKRLEDRAVVADPREAAATSRHIDELVDQWCRLRDDPRTARSGGLRYKNEGKAVVALLKRFNDVGEGWPTLDSMRNVDVEVLVNVRGEK
jgi:superfamily II DNA or RNA helicase